MNPKAHKQQNNAAGQLETDELWMGKALALARRAGAIDEVPVGALIVSNGQVLSMAHNLKEKWNSCLGHAELIAIHRASKALKAWRLLNATLYVTLEPCTMCAGAIQQARISRVVFGAFDPKAGALSSLYKVGEDIRLNHRFDSQGGVLQAQCSQLLTDFFREKRKQSP